LPRRKKSFYDCGVDCSLIIIGRCVIKGKMLESEGWHGDGGSPCNLSEEHKLARHKQDAELLTATERSEGARKYSTVSNEESRYWCPVSFNHTTEYMESSISLLSSHTQWRRAERADTQKRKVTIYIFIISKQLIKFISLPAANHCKYSRQMT